MVNSDSFVPQRTPLTHLRWLKLLVGLTSGVGLILSAGEAIAQLPECPPPQRNEYLLFVLTQTQESQQWTRRSLPPNTNMGTCRYFNDTVTRIGGFRQLEDADRWGRFLKDIAGLYAVVVKPATGQASSPPSPANYNPQPLGTGYAVLVDYFDRPEVANRVGQLLGRNVGLVSYFSRPYLLAIYTQDRGEADEALRRLSDRGFSAVVVDSSRAILLTPAVNY